MTDIITVETSDHARLSLKLSYNWFFEVDPKNREAELGCRNPEFFEVPRARPSFRVFAQIAPNA